MRTTNARAMLSLALLAAATGAALAQAPGPGAVSFTQLYDGNSTVNAAVTLSNDNLIDWAHYGRTDANRFNHYLSPFTNTTLDFVSDRSSVQGTERQGDGNFRFSWTNGTPTATVNNAAGDLYMAGNNGNGFQLTALSPTTRETLKVYVGLSNNVNDQAITGVLTAQLQRNVSGTWQNVLNPTTSSALTVSSPVGTQFRGGYYSLQFGPTTPDQRLLVTYTSSISAAPTGSFIYLAAASVTPAPGSLALLGLGGCVAARRRRG